MARLPRRPTAKRSATAIGRATALAAAEPGLEVVEQDAEQSGQESDLLHEFEAMLRTDESLDSDARNKAVELFSRALESQVAASSQEPGRDASADSIVDTLVACGAIDEAAADGFARELNEAFQALERKESKLAIEFNQRAQRDGEEEALEWLRDQQRALNKSDTDTEDGATVAWDATPANAGDIVKSKSRRLRGPPRR